MEKKAGISILLFFISFFLFTEVALTGFFLHVFIIHTFALGYLEIFLPVLISFMLLSFFLIFSSRVIFFYISLYVALSMFLMEIFSLHESSAGIVLVGFLLYATFIYLNSGKIPGKKIRVTTFFATLTLIAFLGGIISLFQQPYVIPITIETANTLFIGVGHSLPILEKYGIFIISPDMMMTVSPIEFLIFFGISSLVSENYFLIIRYIENKRSAMGKAGAVIYGITGALSCQCESYIALLPAISAFLLDEILLPTVFSSLILLFLTYIFVSKFYMKGRHIFYFEPERWNRNSRLQLLFLSSSVILPPIIVTIGVYFGLQLNPIFFFLSAMYMVLEGYIFSYSIFRFIRPVLRTRLTNTIISTAGVVISLIWYFPYLTGLAYHNGLIFDVMTLSGFLGGIMMAYSYTHSPRAQAYAINEYITVIFSIFPLAIFYMGNVLEIKIWPFFTLEGQIIYSLINWLIMLPVMWLATHISLQNLVSENTCEKVRVSDQKAPETLTNLS